jgi:uncharacterized repeat protein (TIGR01451 family)
MYFPLSSFRLFCRLFFVCIVYLLLLPQGGWAQEFEWVKKITPVVEWKQVKDRQYIVTTDISANVMGTDLQGNVFVAGGVRDSTKVNIEGTNQTYFPNNGLFAAKYDKSGQVLWTRYIGGHCSKAEQGAAITGLTVDGQGNFYLTGQISDSVSTFVGIHNQVRLINAEDYYVGFIAKFDNNGELLWARSFRRFHTPATGLTTDREGNVFIVGDFPQSGINFDDNTVFPFGRGTNDFFIVKYSAQGNLLWFNTGAGVVKEFRFLSTDASGSLFFGGSLYTQAVFRQGGSEFALRISSRNNVFLAKYEADGHLAWAKPIGSGGKPRIDGFYNWAICSGITTDFSGAVYLSGFHTDSVKFEEGKPNQVTLPPGQVFVARVNQVGDLQWVRGFDTNLPAFGAKITCDGHHNLYLAGSYHRQVTFAKGTPSELTLSSEHTKFSHTYFAKFSTSGKFGWAVVAKGDSIVYTHHLTTWNGHMYAVGEYHGKSQFGSINVEPEPVPDDVYISANSFIVDVADRGIQYTDNIIRGTVFEDENANGKKDLSEKALKNIIIKAEPGPYFSSTDSVGNYQLYVDKGSYTISQQFPADKNTIQIQQTYPQSPASYQVNFSSSGKDTAGFDFGNHVTRKPFLKVDVAADRRRRCFRSTTTVYYRNEGSGSANNAQVQVTYPKYVIPISASMAWTSRQDSLLTFDIGTLAPGQGASITLIDSVICGNEAIRGLTQCVKAVITPKNNLSAPDPRWDQSEIELKAVCKNNGFVRLSLLNPGQAMTDSAAYRIYLDAVKVFEGKYKLIGKDSLSLEVPVNGKTIRLEADLRPFHPDGNRQPSITLEGCGTAGIVSISKGFFNQLPQDDAPEEIAVSCLEILDSYDPNDKQVSPAGVGASHIVAEGTPLEYLIRFQNTGTDVAYNVVITDTLDEYLDVSTLQIGAASHPFSWNVSGQGRPVINWTFNNIQLPDSTHDEPNSHGYVRFRIGQKPENGLGNVISNQAAITFDYNSPILTNVTINTVGEIPQQLSSVPIDICKGNYPTTASAGEKISLQTIGTTTLNANIPLKGRGQWKLMSGKGVLADPSDPRSAVTGLAAGLNVFEWTITLCDSVSRSQVSVERVIPIPVVSDPAPVCSGDIMPLLTATGTNLTWYADALLTQPLAQATHFRPTTGGEFFVTQAVDSYESKPAKIAVAVQSRPPAPTVNVPSRLYCSGEAIEPLQATGESLRWYADPALEQQVGTGNTYQPAVANSAVFYVTQTVNHCEGAASPVPITVQPENITLQTNGDTLVAPAADDYQWYFEGKVLTTAIAQSHLVRNTGHYHVVLRKQTCVFSSYPLFVTINVPESILTFLPNPSSDRVQVALTANATGDVTVRVYNALGKMVYHTDWQKSTTTLEQELNLVHLMPGIYFVEVGTNQETLVKKLVRN